MDPARHGSFARSQHVPDTCLCAIKTKRLEKKNTYRRLSITHVRHIHQYWKRTNGEHAVSLSGSVTLQEFDFYCPKIHVASVNRLTQTIPN